MGVSPGGPALRHMAPETTRWSLGTCWHHPDVERNRHLGLPIWGTCAQTWSVTGAVGAASERTAALAEVARSSTLGISRRIRNASTEISPATRNTVSIELAKPALNGWARAGESFWMNDESSVTWARRPLCPPD